MKKLAYVFLAAVLFTACSEDPIVKDQNQLDTVPLVEADLSKMTPLLGLDNSVKGTYSGVLTTVDVSFHAKLFFNIGNDGNFGVHAITADEKYSFDLVESTKNTFTFKSDMGYFTLDATDIDNPKIVNAQINGLDTEGHVKKDRGGARFGIILGTYTGTIYNGTWDFFVDLATTPFIQDVFIVLGSGHTILETALAGDFEVDDPGCYTGGPYAPFYLTSGPIPTPTDALIELYLIGQTREFPDNGTTLLYDFGFSKQICDANGLDYNRMLGSPQVTNGFFFDPPLTLPGCYNIGGPQGGLWVLADTATGAQIDGGFINIDTSSFVPVPPLVTIESDTPTFINATLKK